MFSFNLFALARFLSVNPSWRHGILLLYCLVTTANLYALLKSRPYNPERATSMRSCDGIFTDQFIFRTVLAEF